MKGFTKASVVALIVMIAAELDPQCEKDWNMLTPLLSILDKGWLLPCHVTYLSGIHLIKPPPVFGTKLNPGLILGSQLV